MILLNNRRIVLISFLTALTLLLGYSALLTLKTVELYMPGNYVWIHQVVFLISFLLFYFWGIYTKRAWECKYKDKMNALFDKNVEVIIITRLEDGVITDINEEGLRELGNRREDVIGKTTLTLDIWENEEEREKFYEIISKKGFIKDFRAVLRNVEVRKPFSLTSQVVVINKVRHVITYAKDISKLTEIEKELQMSKDELEYKIMERTQQLANINEELRREIIDRSKMEFALRTSEEKYKELLQSLPVGIYRTTLDGRIVEANKALAEILGTGEVAELMKYNSMDFYGDKDVRREQLDRRLENMEKKNVFEEKLKLRKADGRVIWVNDRGKIGLDERTGFKYFDGILEDITTEEIQKGRLATLYEISNSINSTESLDQLFRSIHMSLSKIVDTENFFIAIYEKEKGFIRFPYLVDEMDDSIEPIPIESTGSFSAKVIRDGKAYLYRKNEIALFIGAADRTWGTTPVVWLGVPLKYGGDVIGAMVVQSYRNKEMYNEEDMALLQSVSDQVALAIEAKRASIALNYQRNFLENLMDTIPMPVFYKDAGEKKYIGCNKAFEELFGFKKDEIIGNTVFDIMSDNAPELQDESDNKVLIEGGKLCYESIIKDKKGNIRNEMFYKSRFNNEFGVIAGIIGVLIDITERKKYEETLKQQSARDAALAELSRAIISLTSLDHISNLILSHTIKLTSSKHGFIAHYNNEKNELASSVYMSNHSGIKKQGMYSFKPEGEDDVWRNLFRTKQSLVTNNVINAVSLGLLDKPIGEVRRMIASPAQSGDVTTAVIGVANSKEKYTEEHIELTERMASLYAVAYQRLKAEEDMRKALEKEQELSELKSRFILMVSHEYRTPLSAIILSSELLEEYGANFSISERKKHFSRIKQSIHTMTKLLDDIILFNKMDVGIIQFQPDFVSLKSFAMSLIYELQLMHRDRCRINFIFSGNESEVYVDEKLLRQILTNLLTNAIKYSHEGDYVEFSITRDKANIKIIIADHGIGIPDNDQKNIFLPFHRGANIANIPGTGLGLSIVKNAVELHRGKINFESIVGQGTKFIISIPITKVPETIKVMTV